MSKSPDRSIRPPSSVVLRCGLGVFLALAGPIVVWTLLVNAHIPPSTPEHNTDSSHVLLGLGSAFLLLGLLLASLWVGRRHAICRQMDEAFHACLQDFHEQGQQHRRTQAALSEAREETETRIRQETRRLAALMAQKQRFVDQLGHDLKTSLTPMLALLPALTRSAHSDHGRDTLEIIHENALYMRDLVEKTLELACLDSENSSLELETFNLTPVLRRLAIHFREMLQAASLHCTCTIEQPVWICGDRLRVKEILHNLVTNAIQHTPAGGSIDIQAEPADDVVVVTVRDTGVGLSKEHLQQVFEEFFQVGQTDRHHKTSGLGLSICRRLVTAHGGHIWIESSGPGCGTAVHVSLPAAQATSPDGGGRCLVVDDNTVNRHYLVSLLEYMGYQTRAACDGIEALDMLGQYECDLIFTDLNMPRMGGRDLLAEVRKRDASAQRHTPVVVITGGDGLDAPEQADATLHKPFYPSDIQSLCERFVSRTV